MVRTFTHSLTFLESTHEPEPGPWKTSHVRHTEGHVEVIIVDLHPRFDLQKHPQK